MQRILFLLAMLLLLPGSPQQAQQSPSAAQAGSIEGSIVRFGTTDPIPRARVQLRPVNSRDSQIVTADEGGRFTFRDLAPGQYRISATRDAYIAGEYGQRSPSGSGVAITLTAQQQLKEARIALIPAGTISGRILNRYGEPAANANVQALRYTYQDGRRNLTPFQTIRTNDLGEYRLFWMPPGQYIISAQGTDSLSVNPGETVFFQAARGAGPALPGAFGAQLGVGGVTRITVTGANSPIEPLPVGPGGPAPPPPPPPPPPPGNVVDDANISLPVYYPGTTDVTAAQPIDLRAGGNLGGVNMTLAEAKPVRIRGQVLSGGRPAAGARVSMFQRRGTTGTLTVRSANVNAETGAFEFRNVAPGAYELVAMLNGFSPTEMIVGTPLGNAAGIVGGVGRGSRDPNAPVMGARAQVDVVAADVEGVSLLLENGFNVTGRVGVEGQSSNSTSNVSGMRIQLQSDPLIPPLSIPPVNPEADGSFSIAGVTPGTYRVTVTGLPRGTYLKTARLGGEDVLNGGLRADGSANGPLEIVLGNTPGTVDATVLDDRQMPIAAVTVALVPQGAQERRYDIYRSATSDASGRIRLESVVPGEYRIYAWESVENGAWTDPDFMRNYENDGTPVRISEGGSSTVNVRLIPYRLN